MSSLLTLDHFQLDLISPHWISHWSYYRQRSTLSKQWHSPYYHYQVLLLVLVLIVQLLRLLLVLNSKLPKSSFQEAIPIPCNIHQNQNMKKPEGEIGGRNMRGHNMLSLVSSSGISIEPDSNSVSNFDTWSKPTQTQISRFPLTVTSFLHNITSASINYYHLINVLVKAYRPKPPTCKTSSLIAYIVIAYWLFTWDAPTRRRWRWFK